MRWSQITNWKVKPSLYYESVTDLLTGTRKHPTLYVVKDSDGDSSEEIQNRKDINHRDERETLTSMLSYILLYVTLVQIARLKQSTRGEQTCHYTEKTKTQINT